MRHSVGILVALWLGMMPLASLAVEPIPTQRQLLVKIRAYESTSEGKPKTLAEPNLVVVEGRTAVFRIGGEVPIVARPKSKQDFAKIGTQVDCVAGVVHGDKVKLDITLTLSDVIDRNAKPLAVWKQVVSTVVEAKFGEKITLEGIKQGSRECWCEVTVEEIPLEANTSKPEKRR